MYIKLKPINIEFKNLTYTVAAGKNNEKRILKCVTGEFRSGEMTAIMGPSGAGKSSLLNILTGYATQNSITGDVHMNNAKLGGKKYSKQCRYILQDDNLYTTFTVQETMMLAASLKIAGVSFEEKEIMIDNVLNTLNLIHTKNTKCGKLSGGQKKRLSIALELLDNPPVLFLDEPTTGLDSASSAYCVRLLHNLSREGRTIVCTIHQPAASIYELFDHVYVLAEGECIYQGSSLNTVPYLSTNGLQCPQYHNPADFLLEVANGEYGNFTSQLAKSSKNDRWRVANEYLESPTVVTDAIEQFQIEPLKKNAAYRMDSNDSREVHEIPTEWRKFWVLISRCHIHYYRDWTVTHLKFVLNIAIAVLIGCIYGQSGTDASKSISNVGSFLIGLAYLWYTTMMPSILKFPTEIAIIKKETFNSWYKIRTFYLAHMVTSAPIHIMFAITYASITFYITCQPRESDRYLKYTLVNILTVLAADGFGLILGSMLDPINGTFVGAIITSFKIAFCGFLAMHSQISTPMQYLMNLSSLKYSFEAVTLAVYDYNRESLVCPTSELYCHYKSPKIIIQELGLKPKNYEFDVAMMVAQMAVFKILAYITLKRRMKLD